MTATPSATPPLPPETKRFAHDLRNCLASMRAGANLLRRSRDNPAIVEKVADGLLEQVQEMLDLLDGFVGRKPGAQENVSTHSSAARSPAAHSSGARPESLRILIAEDNADAASALATYLRLSGHQPSVALDGAAALQLACDDPPDVMLLDIGMPTLNGYELARAVRAQPWGSSVRLVAVSGWFSKEDMEAAAHAGFDAHMSKPIDMDALPQVIQPTR